MATILTPINSLTPTIMTKRERELVNILRCMLKDLPDDVYRSLNTLVEEQRGERWTDTQLLVYVNQAVADLNAEPPLTTFTIENFPDSLRACIVNGAVIFALIAEGILQVGEQFSYSDNGISLSINLAQGYQSMAQMLLSSYVQLKKDIKKSFRPQAAGIHSAPAPYRIRSYAPRQWTYR